MSLKLTLDYIDENGDAIQKVINPTDAGILRMALKMGYQEKVANQTALAQLDVETAKVVAMERGSAERQEAEESLRVLQRTSQQPIDNPVPPHLHVIAGMKASWIQLLRDEQAIETSIKAAAEAATKVADAEAESIINIT